MTFTEWYDDLESRHDASYSGYEDLLEECWYAAQEALIAMQKEHIKQTGFPENIDWPQEPTA